MPSELHQSIQRACAAVPLLSVPVSPWLPPSRRVASCEVRRNYLPEEFTNYGFPGVSANLSRSALRPPHLAATYTPTAPAVSTRCSA